MISERQEKLLDYLIKEYIDTAEPVSSFDLKKVADLDISAATVRNDLQILSKEGYIEQPHTSAGRVPTQKAYKYFTEKFCQEPEKDFSDFIFNEIKQARQQIQEELELTEKLTHSLTQFSITLSIKHSSQLSEKDELFDILNILGGAKPSHEKNIEIIKSLLKKFDI
jgi:heat-inducible transcriptional repressor